MHEPNLQNIPRDFEIVIDKTKPGVSTSVSMRLAFVPGRGKLARMLKVQFYKIRSLHCKILKRFFLFCSCLTDIIVLPKCEKWRNIIPSQPSRFHHYLFALEFRDVNANLFLLKYPKTCKCAEWNTGILWIMSPMANSDLLYYDQPTLKIPALLAFLTMLEFCIMTRAVFSITQDTLHFFTLNRYV